MTKVFYPLIGGGVWGEPGPDWMSIQIYETTGEFADDDGRCPPGPPFDPRTHWRMRDGTLIAIVEMTDSHLRNTIRLLHRAAERWALAMACLPPPNGDEAAMAFAEEMGALASMAPGELIRASNLRKLGEPLLAEWDRRGYYPDTWWARS